MRKTSYPDDGAEGTPPRRSILLASAALLLLLPTALVYVALEFSPVGPSAYEQYTNVQLLGGLVEFYMSPDVKMLVFVMLIAAIGGLISPSEWPARSSRFFLPPRIAVTRHNHWPTDNNHIRYATQPTALLVLGRCVLSSVQGALLGAVCYILVRAAIITPNVGVRGVNPVGMQILAFCAGLFSSNVVKALHRALTVIADRNAPILEAIDRLEQRFDAALSEPTLVFFDGVILVRVVDVRGEDLPLRSGPVASRAFIAKPGQSCTVLVGFLPEVKTTRPDRLTEALTIRHGVRDLLVTFDCSLDCETLSFPFIRSSVTFDPDAPSPLLPFEFTAPMSDRQPEHGPLLQGQKDAVFEHQLYVEVSQKNRLLQSVRAVIHVMENADGP